MRRTYETVYIVSNNITQDEKDAIHSRILDELKNRGAEIIHDQDWGTRTLAYKINKQETGHYRYLAYISDGEAVNKLEFYMKITEPVMRFLTVKISDKETREVPLPNLDNLV